MITGVPDAKELAETALGWLNLAWSTVVSCLDDISSNSEYLWEIENDDQSDEKDREAAARLVEKVERGQKFQVNNALSLLQQSLELLLKARIAEISPFLLIASDPRSWPRGSNGRDIDFSDFKTLDATDLCRVVNTVCAKSLPEKFVGLYNELRVSRNKIVHLDTGKIETEAAKVGVYILTAHNLLFPAEMWTDFRRNHRNVDVREEQNALYLHDFSHDNHMHEIEIVLASFDPAILRRFFGHDKRKKVLKCFGCRTLTSRYYDSSYDYAQKRPDGSIFCCACGMTYADQNTYDEFGRTA